MGSIELSYSTSMDGVLEGYGQLWGKRAWGPDMRAHSALSDAQTEAPKTSPLEKKAISGKYKGYYTGTRRVISDMFRGMNELYNTHYIRGFVSTWR